MTKVSSHLKTGDLILSEDPWAYTVTSKLVDSRCHACLGFLPCQTQDEDSPSLLGTRCSACKYSRYCSVKCQKDDWKKHHKAECPSLKLLAASGYRPPDHFMLMLKILLKSMKCYEGPADFSDPAKNSSNRTFSDLVSHEKEMLLDKDVVNYIPQIRLILAKYMGITHPADLPPVQLIFEIFGKVKCNSYGILDEDMVISGVGIYLNSSLFDHSCQPNACQVFDGPRLFIRATEDIHQISQVRISYIDRFMPMKIRQIQLLDGYFFNCSCLRCQHTDKDAEMFSLKCSGSNCKAMIPSDERASQPCSSCQFVPPNDPSLLSHYIKFLDTFAQNLTKSLSQQALSDLLAEAKEILHPTNPLLATLYADVGRHQTDNQPGGYFSQAVQIYKFWLPLPAVDPLMGWTFLQAARLECSGDPVESWKRLVEAEQMIRLTHGPDHPLYKQILNVLHLSGPAHSIDDGSELSQ